MAGRSRSIEDFGRNLRDWFHELRELTTHAQLLDAVSHRPPRMREAFEKGALADAFLAAQVDFLCRHAGIRSPSWTRCPEYVLAEPWFGSEHLTDPLRAMLIRDADAPFGERNLFTTSEIIWRPRRGRPRKTPEQRKLANRLRQRRFRERQAAK